MSLALIAIGAGVLMGGEGFRRAKMRQAEAKIKQEEGFANGGNDTGKNWSYFQPVYLPNNHTQFNLTPYYYGNGAIHETNIEQGLTFKQREKFRADYDINLYNYKSYEIPRIGTAYQVL